MDAIVALPGLTHSTREYLRDIGDHLAQVTGELYRQTDDLGGLTTTYFNANQNRLNLLATRLTVLAMFFLIWTLVTSFFGQNFKWLTDHIDTFEAFLVYEMLGLVLPTVLAAVYFWRRRREWLVTPRPERLAPETFRLPVERIRDGYYSDAYFNYTKELLEHEGRDPHVTMQVFQRKHSILGGIDEAVAVLKQCAGRRRADGGWEEGWGALDVRALREGDAIAPWETVMTIAGPYPLFAHLETVYLGCVARRTLIMRNVAEVVEAAHGKPILFFPARHDHWLVQTGDGWAAHVAGAIGVSTDAQASWWGGRGVGTVPHALIAAYGGDTVGGGGGVRAALRARHERHRAGRLRQRLGAHGARRGARARAGPLGRAARHLRPARRPVAPARARASTRRRASRPSWSGWPGPSSTPRLHGRADRGLRRLRRRAHPGVRGAAACRSTPTASARR